MSSPQTPGSTLVTDHCEARPMHRTPIVLCDMDGVIADLEAEFWSRWVTRHPQAPGQRDADRSVMDLDLQLPAQHADAVHAILREPGFYTQLPAVPGAKQALNDMLDLGWQVYLCTAPMTSNPTCASDKLAWAEAHLGPGWARRVIVTKDKGLVRGDVLIDDKPTISSVVDPTWVHVVFDATYNQASTGAARLHRWADWRTVLLPLLAPHMTDAGGKG